jgi:aubergine-like protein
MAGYEPKLAVVIVKKRGNARFFQQDGRNIQNPQPGTIIDHTVTNVNIQNTNKFFYQSFSLG